MENFSFKKYANVLMSRKTATTTLYIYLHICIYDVILYALVKASIHFRNAKLTFMMLSSSLSCTFFENEYRYSYLVYTYSEYDEKKQRREKETESKEVEAKCIIVARGNSHRTIAWLNEVVGNLLHEI